MGREQHEAQLQVGRPRARQINEGEFFWIQAAATSAATACFSPQNAANIACHSNPIVPIDDRSPR